MNDFAETFPARLASLVTEWAWKCKLEVPEDLADLISEVMYSRKSDESETGLTWKMRKCSKPEADDRVRCLLSMYHWHSGRHGYNLHTPMSWQFLKDFDPIDSAAMLLLRILERKDSQPMERWSETMDLGGDR